MGPTVTFEGVLIVGDSLQINGDRLNFATGIVSIDMEANRRSVAGLRDALAGVPEAYKGDLLEPRPALRANHMRRRTGRRLARL